MIAYVLLAVLATTMLASSMVPSYAEHKPSHLKWEFDLEQHRERAFDYRNSITHSIHNTCEPEYRVLVYLNHTIQNGTVVGFCSGTPDSFWIEIDADDDGYLIVDIPRRYSIPRILLQLMLFRQNIQPMISTDVLTECIILPSLRTAF